MSHKNRRTQAFVLTKFFTIPPQLRVLKSVI